MIKDELGLIEKIVTEIRKNVDIAVIGLSGGADSTLVAILCTKALGKENVYGVHMPYDSEDEDSFNRRSVKFAENLGIVSYFSSIKKIADAIKTTLNVTSKINGTYEKNNTLIREVSDLPLCEKLSKVNIGNARARARMCVLYGIAHHLGDSGKRARVIGTGNLSEDYIGYDTKGGDALADIFPIGELFKSEVYQLLDFFKKEGIITEEFIDRVPSAGLWNGQKDHIELGYTYGEMEPAIKYLKKLSPIPTLQSIMNFVKKRHESNKHKHEVPKIINVREFCY